MFRKYSSIDALKMLKLPLASTRDERYYIHSHQERVLMQDYLVAWLSGRASPSHGGGHRFKSCSDHHDLSRLETFVSSLFSLQRRVNPLQAKPARIDAAEPAPFRQLGPDGVGRIPLALRGVDQRCCSDGSDDAACGDDRDAQRRLRASAHREIARERLAADVGVPS